MKLFISYSRDDKAWVYELWRALRDRAFHDAWIDQRLIPAQDWWASILQNIENCECCIYVMTPQAVASIYCRAEIDYALAMNKPILPLMLKTCDYPDNLRKLHLQYQIIKDDMSLGDVLFVTERAMGEVREGMLKGKYNLPSAMPLRPDEPKPEQTAAQVLEVFTLAEEAASQKNLSLAERHFQQVIDADPNGYGPAAMMRMKEIRNEYARASEYERITMMIDDFALQRGAQQLWQVFVQKYGTEYDPNKIGIRFNALNKPQAVLPISQPSAVHEIFPATSVSPVEIQPPVEPQIRTQKKIELPPLREEAVTVAPQRVSGGNKRRVFLIGIFLIIGLIVVGILMRPSTTAPSIISDTPLPQTSLVTVAGTANDFASGIYVKKGQKITINASGSVSNCSTDNGGAWCGFYGANGGYATMPVENGGRKYPLAGAMLGALIGRIGSQSPFLIGTHDIFFADSDGQLFFSVNDNVLEDNRGAFDLEITVE